MKVHFDYSKTYIRLAMVLLVGFSTLWASGQDQELSKAKIPKPAKRLIGDYSYSSRTQTPPYTSKQIPYSKLTHIIHFGVGVYTDGTLYVDPNFLEPNLLTQAHKNGVKVLLAVNGGPSSQDVIPALVANVTVFVKEHGYDGVDIDWEAPTVEQGEMFYDLMASLRAALPSPTYLISTDLGWPGSNGYAIPQVNQFLDFFNIENVRLRGTVDSRRATEFPDHLGCERYRPMGVPASRSRQRRHCALPPGRGPAIAAQHWYSFLRLLLRNRVCIVGAMLERKPDEGRKL